MSATMRHGLFCVSVFAGWIFGLRASGQIPGKFEFLRIVDDDAYSSRQAINRKGHVVFPSSPGRVDDPGAEIFLYRDGEVIQITHDNVADRIPDINDDGTIVWFSAIGPVGDYGPTYEIMMRRPDGEVIQLTDNDVDDEGPKINNRGEVVWNAFLRFGCNGGVTRRDLFLFDGVETRRLTFDADDGDGGISNQGAQINDLGQIAWARYDFCTDGEWTSRIMLYDGNTLFPISPEGTRTPQGAALNNRGQVVWSSVDGHGHHVEIWDNGDVRELWRDGGIPAINDRGWVAFAIDDDHQRSDLWLWRNGRAVQLTFSNDEDDQIPDMNRSGEITWTCGRPFWSDVCLLRRRDLISNGAFRAIFPDP
ncbi:MAG: hypothetical protein IT449_05950 [Phycisphaerales bacterium]|nr:hypothetical protein [Phycisphaerales bacterium]